MLLKLYDSSFWRLADQLTAQRISDYYNNLLSLLITKIIWDFIIKLEFILTLQIIYEHLF